jgi:hypothetical protein
MKVPLVLKKRSFFLLGDFHFFLNAKMKDKKLHRGKNSKLAFDP